MANHVQLNNVEHKDIRVITDRSSSLGDNLWYSLLIPREFRAAQSCYPIFFQKDPATGKFLSVALFGFQNGENLFLDQGGWSADYIPLSVLRQPFFIGRKPGVEEGKEKIHHVIHIDMESKRISKSEGELLFKEYGGNTPFLDRVSVMLETLHQGILEMDQFINILLMYDLLEPFTLAITLNDGSKNQLVGFYTINEEKLKILDEDAIIKMHRSGYLEAIYMILGSYSRISYLIEQKNYRLLAKTA